MLYTPQAICVVVLFQLRYWSLDVFDVILLKVHRPRAFGFTGGEFWLVPARFRHDLSLLGVDVVNCFASTHGQEVGRGCLALLHLPLFLVSEPINDALQVLFRLNELLLVRRDLLLPARMRNFHLALPILVAERPLFKENIFDVLVLLARPPVHLLLKSFLLLDCLSNLLYLLALRITSFLRLGS